MDAPDNSLLADLLGPTWRLLFYTEDSVAWIARTGNRDGSFDTLRLSREATLTMVDLLKHNLIESVFVESNKSMIVKLGSAHAIIDLSKPSFIVAYHMRAEVECQMPRISPVAALTLTFFCATLAEEVIEKARRV